MAPPLRHAAITPPLRDFTPMPLPPRHVLRHIDFAPMRHYD